MFRLRGKPKNLLATSLVGVGFPMLLVALVLASAMPSSRIYPPFVIDAAEELSVVWDEAREVAAIKTSPVLVDLAGWELYLHRAEICLSSVVLTLTGDALSTSASRASGTYPMAAVPSVAVGAHYQPQAPPA